MNKDYILKFLRVLVCIAIPLTLLIFGVHHCILRGIDNDTDAIVINANYWSSIVGSLIAGFLTLIGVRLTISFYKESDRQQRRLEYMPYLMLRSCYDSCNLDSDFDATYEQEGEFTEYNIEIKNIGNQYAQLNEIYDGLTSVVIGYSYVIPKDDSIFIRFRITKPSLYEGHKFYITYSDALGNNYLQKYNLRLPLDDSGYFNLQIENGYPELNKNDKLINQLFS